MDLRRPCSPSPGSAPALLAHASTDALAPLLVASPGSGPPGSPNLSPRLSVGPLDSTIHMTETLQTLGVYTVTRRVPLERLDGSYLELTHNRTGARHIHIDCPDDNSGFAVFFPTPPADSTGVAHILEHVVLAGSQRFPVRDPFFKIGRASCRERVLGVCS